MTQGSTTHFSYDAFGQLTGLEDDLGRRYSLEYFDDPKPESEGGDGPRYGLLKKVKDWVEGTPRTVEYEWDEDRRLVKVKLPEVTTTAPEYGQYAFTGSSRPTVTYQYEPSANVTSSKTDTTAILHGDFAKLRLEGFEQPGSDVLRARFEYESATGRVKTVAFPDASDVNAGGSGVQWKLEYPSQAADASPVTKALVKPPWAEFTGYWIEHEIDKGRAKKITEREAEALAKDEVLLASGVSIPRHDLVTSFDEYEDDGRLKKVTNPEGSTITYTYQGGEDLLARANLTRIETTAAGDLKGTADHSSTHQSFQYGPQAGDSGDNLPTAVLDSKDRTIELPVPPSCSEPCTRAIEAGYPAEKVRSKLTFDRFGRRLTSESDAPPPGTNPDRSTAKSEVTYGAEPTTTPGAGYLKSITAGGGTTTLEHDEYGNAKLVTSPTGRHEARFDQWDRPIDETLGKAVGAFTDVSARSARAFDAAGRLVVEGHQQKGVGWVETRFEYNARDQVKKVTRTGLASEAPGGGASAQATTTHTFDQYGRLATTQSPTGITTIFSHDTSGRVIAADTGQTQKTRRAFDLMGRLVFESDGYNTVWRGTYDAWGRLYREDLASGAVIRRVFDAAGGLTRETTLAGAGAFDAPDGVQRLTDATFEYGADGRLRKARQSTRLGASPAEDEILTQNFEYDTAGRLDAVIARSAEHTETDRVELLRRFEPILGRLISEKDAAGNLVRYGYFSGTSLPNSITVEEEGHGGQYTVEARPSYDALGREIARQIGLHVTTVTRDEVGNILTAYHSGQRWSYAWDGEGKMVKAEGHGSQSAGFGYDLEGRLVARRVHRSAGDELTRTTYQQEWLSRIDYPGGTFETFTPTPDGLIASLRTRSGITLTNSYDAADRLTSVVPSLAGAAPVGFAALDAGDVFAYDGLSRLTAAGLKTETGIDPRRQLTVSPDPRGLPLSETTSTVLDERDITLGLGRSFDVFGGTTRVTLPSLASDGTLGAFSITPDELLRPTVVTGLDLSGSALPGFGATLSWAGAGRPRRVLTRGGVILDEAYGYQQGSGLLDGVRYQAGAGALGAFDLYPDPVTHFLKGRTTRSGVGKRSLLTNQATAWSADGAQRLATASLGGSSSARPVGDWTFVHGVDGELAGGIEARRGSVAFSLGWSGRIDSRTDGDGEPAAFSYTSDGRRIADDRFTYTWDWRGNLVAVEVNDGAELADAAGANLADHRVEYTYDRAGRLLSRTHLSEVQGDGTRRFVAASVFTWDGGTLLVETGLNHGRFPIWRKQYLPGPAGPAQLRIERDGEPVHVLALAHDEQGSVIGVLEDGEGFPGAVPLRARVLYTPYGEAHLEAGPKLLRLAFDLELTGLGGQEQVVSEDPPSAGGGLRITTTVEIDPESFERGLVFERWLQDTGEWVPVDPASVVIASIETDEDDADLGIMPLAGFPRGERYRLTIKPQLADAFGRTLRLPKGEPPTGLVRVFDIPAEAFPALDQEWLLAFDTVVAASDTLDQLVPGGMSLLYGGLWHDPVTGMAWNGEQWYDARNTSFLDEDADAGATESLYAFAGGAPNALPEPFLGVGAADYSWAEGMTGAPFAPNPWASAFSLWGNARVHGAMRLAGAGAEAKAGFAALSGGNPWVAAGIWVHAATEAVTGGLEVASGEDLRSPTEMLGEGIAKLAGASDETAATVGDVSGFATTVALSSAGFRTAAKGFKLFAGESGGLGWGEIGADQYAAARRVLRFPGRGVYRPGNVMSDGRIAGIGPGAAHPLEYASASPVTGGQASPVLQTQRELSLVVNRQGAVVDRWLRTSQSRWAVLYRSVERANPNFAKGIRGRILDRRMNAIFGEMFGDIPGVRIDQTLIGSGSALRPDLYLPHLSRGGVIFEVGGPSKLKGLSKYQGLAKHVIPIIPKQWF